MAARGEWEQVKRSVVPSLSANSTRVELVGVYRIW
jgi:hypothetical protein